VSDTGVVQNARRFQPLESTALRVEELRTRSQLDVDEVEPQLIEESRRQELAAGGGAAQDDHLTVIRRSSCGSECALDAFGDEREGASTGVDDRRRWTMCDDEDGEAMEGLRVGVPVGLAEVEHPSAEDDGAGASEHLGPNALPHLGCVDEHPVVEALAVVAHRVLGADIGPGGVAVERDGQFQNHAAHGSVTSRGG